MLKMLFNICNWLYPDGIYPSFYHGKDSYHKVVRRKLLIIYMVLDMVLAIEKMVFFIYMLLIRWYYLYDNIGK